jgi:hypothetical protein
MAAAGGSPFFDARRAFQVALGHGCRLAKEYAAGKE